MKCSNYRLLGFLCLRCGALFCFCRGLRAPLYERRQVRARPTGFGLGAGCIRLIELAYQRGDHGRRLLVERGQHGFASDGAEDAPRHVEPALFVFQLCDENVDRTLTVGFAFQVEQVGLRCERLEQLGGLSVGQH